MRPDLLRAVDDGAQFIAPRDDGPVAGFLLLEPDALPGDLVVAHVHDVANPLARQPARVHGALKAWRAGGGVSPYTLTSDAGVESSSRLQGCFRAAELLRQGAEVFPMPAGVFPF